MSFFEKVDEHIEYMLSEGVLPDSDEILEMEVWGQQAGPQHSGDEGGPKSAPGAVFPWTGKLRAADRFQGACTGTSIPPAMFSTQPANIPPAMFSGAAVESVAEEDVIAAVLADLEDLTNR